jgi:sulfide:quinone oxidoreductase
VAARLAATFRGEAPSATFDGAGACFLEVGDGMASMVSGEFLADPPQVQLEEPSAAHLAAKHAFEQDRLAAWFGA